MKMKSLIVVLVLQIFVGHSMSDVIDDNREFAMNTIKECVDESKVKPASLSLAIEVVGSEQEETIGFFICYDQRMESGTGLTKYCEEEEPNDSMTCYDKILVDYVRDYLK